MSPVLTLQEALALYFDAGNMTKVQLRALGERLGIEASPRETRECLLRAMRWELGKIIKEARTHEARRTQEQEQAAKAVPRKAR